MAGKLGTIVRRPIVFVVAGILCLGGALALSTGASAAPPPPGNNGTLKIHEQGTPDGTENNDPKVCVFNVEAFNLDPGQEGTLVFTVQGGDGPTGTPAGPFDFGPADANGFFASQYFNLQPGHYKATLFGKGTPGGPASGVKAKSKVFKVTCAEEPSPSPSVVPSESVSPSPSVAPSESVSPSPSVGPSESVSPSPSVAPSGATNPSPAVLPAQATRGQQVPQVPAGGVSAGGGSSSETLQTALLLLGITFLGAGAVSSMFRRRAVLAA